MPVTPTRTIWKNGEFIPFEDATLHVLSHVVHYGTSWFEGIRSYKTEKGTAIFRLEDHMSRFRDSLKVYRTALPFSPDELVSAAIDLVQRNGLDTCYIRPVAFRGFGDMGLYALRCPLEVFMVAWQWGAYLGDEAAELGVDVCISSWDRITPNALPSASKAGGNYMNSQLVKMEAVENGYAEGICLDSYGNISEGSGENVFVVSNGELITPPAASSLLPGITRDTVCTLAEELGIVVKERNIPRAMLYTCDEMFLVGTAVEITPVRTVDRIPVGNGGIGPITKRIQTAFCDIVVSGNDSHNWLTWVTKKTAPKKSTAAAKKTAPRKSTAKNKSARK